MSILPSALSATFERFVSSEQAGGKLLIVCTFLSLVLSNSPLGEPYLAFWDGTIAQMTLEHWVNDGLMAIFFLLIGLELERELYVGELANFRSALLPIVAAIGGMVTPAFLHWLFNGGTPTQPGVGIPMATDIAFALGALGMLGNRVPLSLKVFVVAFAVMDDLGAIILIAVFYTTKLSVTYLVGALAVWGLLLAMNKVLRIMTLIPYLLGGGVMWGLMLKSGVHATLAGVLLAFAIPFSSVDEGSQSPSHRLEHWLHLPVALVILPVFALANTGIVIGADWLQQLASVNSAGIAAGLLIGKPVGVTVFCALAVGLGICRLPGDLKWNHVFGAGLLGGIGFTMSIFIANLAFVGDPALIKSSKMAILASSLLAGTLGFWWLKSFSRQDGREAVTRNG
ncbi:MAG TPA: Na+/H+ antiporter NhaA [Accumulibacter sp.]|nr:Na+/H+ antiporter NhaA [Accumulibacter sp.]HMW16382.1 Na+/H+ antiporter NhaA [Accumulibacter sp.]HMX21477.1 Na+/H+ antiporter NhaA [Accumulibacter sp.]HMY06069.1 Na+/H+ antiporter NhaA [Accumulibacter sp.]HNC18942.1 Na+/H+ antiporter NhaA [Accumulibacter sp.]